MSQFPSQPRFTYDPEPMLRDLTQPQREAVLCTEGPLLVLAGPGSGKTRVITRRIAHLVGMGVRPWQILAVTFTNKAAAEMKHRVGSILTSEEQTKGLTVTTFHSLCVRMLRRYCELAAASGFPVVKPTFSVYDADDQLALIKKAVEELQLATSNFPPRTLQGVISNAKNDLLDADEYTRLASDFYTRTVAKVYQVYQRKLREADAVDFDDLLVLTAKMLKMCEPVRKEVRKKYRYLLVDEYQDTNGAQLAIASLIAGEDPGPAAAEAGAPVPNICVVGDPDQSIYGWRGADISNILEFEEHFPSARVIALGENFRSLAPILLTADQLIQQNKKRKHKPLIPMRKPKPGQADKVEVVICRDEHHEAALVLDYLRARKQEGMSWKDMAVFYRNNALSRVMEDTLRRDGVPYVLVRGTAFFDREEVKHVLSYLRIIANPSDSVSLARIVNTPARGISDTTWTKLEAIATEKRLTVFEVMRRPTLLSAMLARAQQSVSKFVDMVEGWAGGRVGEAEEFMGAQVQGSGEEAAPVGALAELVARVIGESGLELMYSGEDERKENLAEVVSSAREFEEVYRSELGAAGEPQAATLAADDDNPLPALDEIDPEGVERRGATTLDMLRAYLERVALVADTDAIDPATGAVTLMTLHAAKGLEYRAVALIGLEEGLLPHSRSLESEPALEEERRLCFVGITRAMDRLIMTASNYRTIRGLSERQIPSRFIDEIRSESVTISDRGDAMGFDENDEHDQGMRDFVRGGSAGGAAARQRGVEFGDTRKITAASGGSAHQTEWAVGMSVRHPQFGVGKIEAVSGGADARVKIKFGIGTKTLVLAYARLEKLGI